MGEEKVIQDVLVSAGIELIFFLVAGIVLCFGHKDNEKNPKPVWLSNPAFFSLTLHYRKPIFPFLPEKRR